MRGVTRDDLPFFPIFTVRMANRLSIPTYCQSPTGTVSPPDYRALLIGINYTADENTSERGYRPLQGSVEDAKEVKEVLIGGVSTVALPFTGFNATIHRAL